MRALLLGPESKLKYYQRGFAKLGHKADIWSKDAEPVADDLEDYDFLVGYRGAAMLKPDLDLEMSPHLGAQMGLPVVQLYDTDKLPEEINQSTCYILHESLHEARRWSNIIKEKADVENLVSPLTRKSDPGETVQSMINFVHGDFYSRLSRDASQDKDYKEHVKQKMLAKGEWSEPFQVYKDKESGVPTHIITKPRVTIDRYGNVMKSDLVTANPYFKDKIAFFATMDNMDKRVAEWSKVLKANLKRVDESIANGVKPIPQHDVLYVVAPGPSLQFNWEALKDIKNGHVIAVNKAHKVIGTDLVDYYMALDSRSPDEWFESDMSDIDAYLSVCVNPRAGEGNYKSATWFTDTNLSQLDMVLGDRKTKLLNLDHGLSVLYSATDLAIRMGVKTVVFVGVDGSFRGREVHPGETMEQWGFNDSHQIKDINGNMVWTNSLYGTITTHLLGKIAFMMMNGVRVINATEGGVLSITIQNDGKRYSIEQRKLSEVVSELNGGLTNG